VLAAIIEPVNEAALLQFIDEAQIDEIFRLCIGSLEIKGGLDLKRMLKAVHCWLSIYSPVHCGGIMMLILRFQIAPFIT
jgi:hypothetical protein